MLEYIEDLRNSHTIYLACTDRLLETHSYEALCCKVVELIGFVCIDNIPHIAIVHEIELYDLDMRKYPKSLELLSSEFARTTSKSYNLISLGVEELREPCPILTSDTCYKSSFCKKIISHKL
jgi:hypothetical protein